METLLNNTHCSVCIYRNLIFGSLTPDELNIITRGKKELSFRKGEIICLEGDPIKDFLYLKTGLVKLFKIGDGEKSQIISINKPGDFVTLLSLFSESRYKYTISALEDSVLCSVDVTTFKEIVRTNDTFSMEIMRKMSTIYDEIIENAFNIAKKNLRGRIAYILLFFSQNIYMSNDFELPISRKEISELIQMTTENVIRILSEFRKDRIISISGKQIVILDPDRLDKICHLG